LQQEKEFEKDEKPKKVKTSSKKKSKGKTAGRTGIPKLPFLNN